MAERHIHPCGCECECAQPVEPLCCAHAVGEPIGDDARAAIMAARWPGERGRLLGYLAARIEAAQG